MSRTVTLTNLLSKIRFQADLVGATVRHPDADVTVLVNDSIQEFREAISNEGNQHYLVPYSGTLTAGATSPYSFGSLDLSAISPAIVRTYGLDVTVDGVVHSLDHRPFTERNIWGGPATTGIPRHWAHYQTAKLAIQPAPNASYAYTLWYLPVLADLSSGSDTFDGVAGWEQWIVWDVVCRLLIRDQQGAAFASAKIYRDDAWSRIQRQATRVSSAGGAVVGRDTLRGRIPDPLVGRGPVMAGGGPPAEHSITLAMLVELTGPVFLGRQLSSMGDVEAMTPAESAAILPTFTPSAAGLVPAAGGSATNKFLSQAGTFETVAGGGGGGGSPGGPTGSIQFNGLSGFVGYTGFAIQGSPPSMTVRLPGSLRVTGGTVDVGSGTVRISASGIDLGGGALERVATLVSFPTFGAGVPGLVPGSDGSQANYLRGDGQFAQPPGTPSGLPLSVQFRGSSGFEGADIYVVASGAALGFGPAGAGALFSNGFLRFPHSSTPIARGAGASGVEDALIRFGANGTNEVTWGGGVSIQNQRWRVQPSGTYTFESQTGNPIFHLGPGYVDFKGGSPTGIADSSIQNRSLSTVPSGTVKGSFGATGTPQDINVPTLAALFPTFTSNRAGLVAPGDGDTGKFLNAAGAFATPPAGSGGSPSGVTFSIQFNNSGTFEGATGIKVGGSGMALAFGAAPADGGTLRLSDGQTLSWPNPAGFAMDGLSAAGGAFVVGSPSATELTLTTGRAIRARVYNERFYIHVNDTARYSFDDTIANFTGRNLSNVGIATVSTMMASAAHVGILTLGTGLANDYLAHVPSGTVRGRFSGTGPPQDVRIATLLSFSPTFTSTTPGYVPPSGGGLLNFLRADGAFAAPTGFVWTPTGLPNANLAPMPSGTVKTNLSGTAAPSDVIIPTLAAFFPTFTANRAGLVAPGDGDTGKFLNAAGAFATPPAGAGGAPSGANFSVQFNNSGSFEGATGIRVGQSGMALHFGPSGGLGNFAPAGVMSVSPTGMDLAGNLSMPTNTSRMLALTLGSGIFTPYINALPADANQLKRGANIGIASGLRLYVPKGASTGANRYLVPSGALGTNISIILWPTGARAGNTIRIERLDRSAGRIDVSTPTGTLLYSMPSGAAEVADFVFSKPSGAVFEFGGSGELF